MASHAEDEGEFRGSDSCCRLNVVTMDVRRLRDRREDVAMLSAALQRSGRCTVRFSLADMDPRANAQVDRGRTGLAICGSSEDYAGAAGAAASKKTP